MPIHMEIGLEAIGNYRRMSYEIWYALAEFVDNSTQSYFNNAEQLDRMFEQEDSCLKVKITYDGNKLSICDNAMGMDYDELQHALCIAARPRNPNGRCRYGMGMKTSACWIGNLWTVTTKKLGDTNEYCIEIDVNKIVENRSGDLVTKTREDLPEEQHYTRLDIYRHNREFKGRTIGKIKDYLKSFYRQDFRDEALELYYNNERLLWEEFENRLRKNRAGEPYKKEFSFEVNDKNVHGWAGVFEAGKARDAGFSILHSNRVLLGWPQAWKPEGIFKNDRLISQRLVGEIHLDQFEVTHTKDDILWYADEEEQVEVELAKEISDLIGVATSSRFPGVPDGSPGPTAAQIDVAINEFGQEIKSPEMADTVSDPDIPDITILKDSWHNISEPIKSSNQPDIRAQLGSTSVLIYLARPDNTELSASDPYVVYEPPMEDGAGSKIIVIINMRHPFISQISDENDLMNYFRHCVYDAIAEHRAKQQSAQLEPHTIKYLKDRLLRVPFEIEEHSR